MGPYSSECLHKLCALPRVKASIGRDISLKHSAPSLHGPLCRSCACRGQATRWKGIRTCGCCEPTWKRFCRGTGLRTLCQPIRQVHHPTDHWQMHAGSSPVSADCWSCSCMSACERGRGCPMVCECSGHLAVKTRMLMAGDARKAPGASRQMSRQLSSLPGPAMQLHGRAAQVSVISAESSMPPMRWSRILQGFRHPGQYVYSPAASVGYLATWRVSVHTEHASLFEASDGAQQGVHQIPLPFTL